MDVINAQGVIVLEKEPFDQNKYINEFKRKNLDRIPIEVPKGKREILKKIAIDHNTSVNQLVIGAVEEKYKIDLTTKGEVQ